jgi:Zn-dependent peptidase ImmA (M78 family)/transcriptional regulator with XRE-family HTH domain
LEEKLRQLIGRNLKTARESIGLSQEVFAEKLGISRATLSAVENGHVSIDSTKLIMASRALSRPINEFFKEEGEELAFLYRAAEKMVPSEQVRAKFQNFCEAYREIEEIVGVADNVLAPPEYPFTPQHNSKPLQFAAQVAASERERLGLGKAEPITNIFTLLEENGVRILAREIEQDDLFGVSAFSKQYGPCIFVNSRNTIERQMFTLAHEYGHLLMHRDRYRNANPTTERETDLEAMAHEFARRFLVAPPALNEFLARNVGDRKIGLEDIVTAKHHFKVSLKVISLSLLNERRISENDKKDLWAKADQLGRAEFAPLDKDKFFKDWVEVRRFETLARKAVMAEMISIGKLSEILDQNLLETRTQVQAWRKELSFASARLT